MDAGPLGRPVGHGCLEVQVCLCISALRHIRESVVPCSASSYQELGLTPDALNLPCSGLLQAPWWPLGGPGLGPERGAEAEFENACRALCHHRESRASWAICAQRAGFPHWFPGLVAINQHRNSPLTRGFRALWCQRAGKGLGLQDCYGRLHQAFPRPLSCGPSGYTDPLLGSGLCPPLEDFERADTYLCGKGPHWAKGSQGAVPHAPARTGAQWCRDVGCAPLLSSPRRGLWQAVITEQPVMKKCPRGRPGLRQGQHAVRERLRVGRGEGPRVRAQAPSEALLVLLTSWCTLFPPRPGSLRQCVPACGTWGASPAVTLRSVWVLGVRFLP